jgi:predicted phosphodiesterase
MGPLRTGAHVLLGSGRFPTLSDWRARTRRGGGPHARGVRVFAVEPTTVQLDWAALGPGPVTFRAADVAVDVVADGGPGVVSLDGLPSGRSLTVTATGAGVPRRAGADGTIRLPVTTPAPPPGAELARIATISDAHIGETTFGYLHTIGEPRHTAARDAHSLRAVRAAVDESLTWGAQRLVCKGDIVDQSHPGHWADTLAVLDGVPVPVHLVAGNHEVKKRRSVDPGDALVGTHVAYTDHVDAVDLGGASLVLVNSSLPDHERGELASTGDDLVAALAGSDGGALVAMHHHLRTGNAVSAWPVGVPRAEAVEVLDRIARVHPHTMITSGHVHRNRFRRHGPLVLTCVGSVKDYPGVWAGYVFHEGGMRQVIRRVAEPSVVAWTDRTGDALVGFYRFWTPSTLAKRCPIVTWS